MHLKMTPKNPSKTDNAEYVSHFNYGRLRTSLWLEKNLYFQNDHFLEENHQICQMFIKK